MKVYLNLNKAKTDQKYYYKPLLASEFFFCHKHNRKMPYGQRNHDDAKICFGLQTHIIPRALHCGKELYIMFCVN